MPRNLGSLLREIARNGRQSQRLGPTKRLTREELKRVLDLTETDMLLQLTSDTVGQQDAQLIISVKLTPYQAIWDKTGI